MHAVLKESRTLKITQSHIITRSRLFKSIGSGDILKLFKNLGRQGDLFANLSSGKFTLWSVHASCVEYRGLFTKHIISHRFGPDVQQNATNSTIFFFSFVVYL